MPLVAKTLRMSIGNSGKRPNQSESRLRHQSFPRKIQKVAPQMGLLNQFESNWPLQLRKTLFSVAYEEKKIVRRLQR
jgi:hypothetical protein